MQDSLYSENTAQKKYYPELLENAGTYLHYVEMRIFNPKMLLNENLVQNDYTTMYCDFSCAKILGREQSLKSMYLVMYPVKK